MHCSDIINGDSFKVTDTLWDGIPDTLQRDSFNDGAAASSRHAHVFCVLTHRPLVIFGHFGECVKGQG